MNATLRPRLDREIKSKIADLNTVDSIIIGCEDPHEVGGGGVPDQDLPVVGARAHKLTARTEKIGLLNRQGLYLICENEFSLSTAITFCMTYTPEQFSPVFFQFCFPLKLSFFSPCIVLYNVTPYSA